jgi:hypothetical protein
VGSSELSPIHRRTGHPSSIRPRHTDRVVGRRTEEPSLTIQIRRRHTTAALSAVQAHRGTEGSNLFPSSRQSVSRGIYPSCIEKPAVAAACVGSARRYSRQRRARLVKITPGAENISVERYSSTAVPDRRFAIWLQWCATRGRVGPGPQRCDWR